MTLQQKLTAINIYQNLRGDSDVVGFEIASLDVNIAYRVVCEWLLDNGFWLVEIC